jgi:hypothetical protein
MNKILFIKQIFIIMSFSVINLMFNEYTIYIIVLQCWNTAASKHPTKRENTALAKKGWTPRGYRLRRLWPAFYIVQAAMIKMRVSWHIRLYSSSVTWPVILNMAGDSTCPGAAVWRRQHQKWNLSSVQSGKPDISGRQVSGVNPRPLDCWAREFESHWMRRYSSLAFVVLCR